MKFTKVAYTAQLKATKTIQNKFMICTFHASLLTTEMRYDSYLFSSFLFVGDNLIVLSLVLIACLCEYLVNYRETSGLPFPASPLIEVSLYGTIS